MDLRNIMIIKSIKTIRCLVFGTSCLIALHAGSALSHEDAEQAGKVDFQISCGEVSQLAMNNGMAQLHNMMYVEAEEIFKTAAGKDPGCAMLYWGIAMTRFHPLWPGRPSEEDMAVGTTAIQKAQAVGGGSQRENDFIAAVSTIYLPTTQQTGMNELPPGLQDKDKSTIVTRTMSMQPRYLRFRISRRLTSLIKH